VTKKRRIFDDSFKLQVVKMIKEQGPRVSQVCEDMNPGESATRCWVKQVDDELAGGSGIGKPLTAEQQRIREREKELKILRLGITICGQSVHLSPGTD
jgi:transposase